MGGMASETRGAPPRPLALTMGDPAGVGPEIALKAWRGRMQHGLAPFAMIASRTALAERAALISLDVPLETIADFTLVPDIFADALPVIDQPLAAPVVAGHPNSFNAAAVIASIDRAVEAVACGVASAVVTCPIAKSVLYGTGFAYPGHTEYLGHLAQTRFGGTTRVTPVMMLASDELRVVPLTVHVPLADVPRLVTHDLIVSTARITAAALARDFGCTRPRIAVAGLNPHAGESGTIGREDIEVVGPAVEALRAEGLDVAGPLPADTMFHAAARARYDAAIAMYHDQALIPIKTLAFDRGVNVTLGLPFIRTSPDHGTAFDIAARGIADASSLVAALRMAADMTRRRSDASS